MGLLTVQYLPDECMLRILDYLWNDTMIVSFFKRKSQCAKDYDQQRIHQTLRLRSITPLHVCSSWRACSLRRFFRYIMVDLRSSTIVSLPFSAKYFVERLFILSFSITGTVEQTTQRLVSCLPFDLPNAHLLGLCLFEKPDQFSQAPSHSNNTSKTLPSFGLAHALCNRMPRLSQICFQTLCTLSDYDYFFTNALIADTCHAELNHHSSNLSLPAITAIYLPYLSTSPNNLATNIIRANAHTLRFLSVGSISGSALSNILYHQSTVNPDQLTTTELYNKQLIYPKLRRLLFTVESNAHIYSHLPNFYVCPFPQLEELYFDDTLSNGLPREEWYAPLFDTFLKHQNLNLRHLTFPIVYNTKRIVSQHNCPNLIGLRHIKCCWATGFWSSLQSDSDSTRVLKAIASIPTLQCYVHPSYIAKLSGLPTDILCKQLACLDLYGWPLTLFDVTWILQSFGCLQTLRVTVVNQEENTTTAVSNSNMCLTVSPLSRMVVGATSTGLDSNGLTGLFNIIKTLPSLTAVSLYSEAYAFVKSVVYSENRHHMSLHSVEITNLDSWELSGQFTNNTSRPFQSPLASHTTADNTTNTSLSQMLSSPSPLLMRRNVATRAQNTGNTSWNFVHQLLVDG
ncbi:hypothetical protein COEREDRAFT_80875 [Coemansia reversa NRRL 1564]|uniref:Uncharacterized protein n=1 Tax=Coemansia reversa (strain ATCC 12441 / NRRL 1564) TaxID=763665 RepID=A0A2G5BCP6_COERN|nr:hypothetical protein COEREDRAFT_80875 [Coemansia reversa NRRL 1564]|eukprot:PIA16794.1 hypothetical protein COEREDRAFT_80875 [Coemansia reversa NRRL 1564]